MDENMRSRLAESVRSFHIPRLGEIPDVGLYLEQVTRYVNQSITGCGLSPITASMVSNYVKQKIIPGPEKKAYGAESIAYLIFVSCIKSVVAMDDIRALIGIQHETYDLPTAYHYFCEEFENLIRYVFGASDHLASVGQDESDEKELLRSALLSVTQKITANKKFCDCEFAWRFAGGAHGVSLGKTLPVIPEEETTHYEKAAFTVENAAVIPCTQVLGAYQVTFER